MIFAVLAMCCFLTALITLAAFAPNYLTDHLKLSLDQMSLVLAGQGIGSFVGMVAVPAFSDRVGRKPAMLVAQAVAFLALLVLMNTGPDPMMLFMAMFVAMFMISGVLAINIGPLTSASVPPSIAATATGLVVGVGEIVGGAIAPAIAGGMADAMGIPVILKIAMIAIGVSILVVAVGVREPKTAP